MGKILDLRRQRFGKLTVLCFIGLKNRRVAQWKCICDCGNTVIILSKYLRKGTKSCGCLLKDVNRSKNKQKSSSWRGDKVKYRALHQRMYKEVPKPIKCNFCKIKPVEHLANISQKYKLTPNDWMWLCAECHSRYDNNWVFKNNKWFKTCIKCNNKLEVSRNNFYKRKSGRWLPYCKKCSKSISINVWKNTSKSRIKNKECIDCCIKMQTTQKNDRLYQRCDRCRASRNRDKKDKSDAILLQM